MSTLALVPRYAPVMNPYFRRFVRYANDPVVQRSAARMAQMAKRRVARFVQARMRRRQNRDRTVRNARTRSGPNAQQGGPSFQTFAGTPQTLRVKTLDSTVIQFPARNGAEHDRLRESIFLNGIKICLNFKNDATYPVVVHIVVCRQRTRSSSQVDSATSMFRNYTNNDSYDTGFINDLADNTYNHQYECLGLNKEKMHILTHSRLTLQPDTSSNGGRHIKEWRRYFKIKKRITFDTSSDTTPQFPFYLMMWYQPKHSGDYATNTSIVSYDKMTHVFYKNISM